MLGSGLGELADRLEDRVEIPYGELPGFHAGGLAGHAGALVLGELSGTPVGDLLRPLARLRGDRGRRHHDADPHAQGARRRHARAHERRRLAAPRGRAGQPRVPQRPHQPDGLQPARSGPNDEDAGPRFPSLRDAYDPELRARLHAAADALGTELHDGVYLAVSGPAFETPAEIRAFRTLGADLVGMSTVPEVIAARHAGLRVAAVSAVTNLAEGMGGEELSHEQTLRVAKEGAARLGPLIERFVEDL